MKAMEHKTLINLFRCHSDFKVNVTATESSRLSFCFLKSGRRIRRHACVELRLIYSAQHMWDFCCMEHTVQCVVVAPTLIQNNRLMPNTGVMWHFRGHGRQGHHCFPLLLNLKQVCTDYSIIQICPNTGFIPALIHQTLHFSLLVLIFFPPFFFFFFLVRQD